MALNIEGATLGYDASGVNAYISDINTNLVDEACSQLRKGLEELRVATDEVWVGRSAETFKANMEHDVEEICNAIIQAKNSLITELNALGNRMGELDENLVKPR